MAANNNVSETESKSVTSLKKCTIRRALVRNLLNSSSENCKITSEALDKVVEVANCIVIETCMRAANQAKKAESSQVKDEHVLKSLHQLMLDFP